MLLAQTWLYYNYGLFINRRSQVRQLLRRWILGEERWPACRVRIFGVRQKKKLETRKQQQHFVRCWYHGHVCKLTESAYKQKPEQMRDKWYKTARRLEYLRGHDLELVIEHECSFHEHLKNEASAEERSLVREIKKSVKVAFRLRNTLMGGE